MKGAAELLRPDWLGQESEKKVSCQPPAVVGAGSYIINRSCRSASAKRGYFESAFAQWLPDQGRLSLGTTEHRGSHAAPGQTGLSHASLVVKTKQGGETGHGDGERLTAPYFLKMLKSKHVTDGHLYQRENFAWL
jgi:hypothetical protein